MLDKEIAYVAAVKQPVDKTLSNIAAIDSGFFSGFVNPLDSDILSRELSQIRAHEQMHFLHYRESKKLGRAAQSEALKKLGLSKGAKVGHVQRQAKINAIFERQRVLNKSLRPDSVLSSSECYSSSDALYEQAETAHENGSSRFYLMSREWSGQFKGQMIYKPRPSDAPPSNNGERYTEKLSGSAVRKIFESGAYVAACHGGFSTFLTLTFTASQRNEIFSGNVTLGSEVSRFINAVKKMYRRGWVADSITLRNEESGKKYCPLPRRSEQVGGHGSRADFHYIWVAECPANDDGEANPHVHMLLNWNVEPCYFEAWAQRLENIWGNGFAHIERIKYGQAASGYLIKAVGYAAKGDNADQGLIKGNRYNIARCSRAPSWDVLASFEAGNMAAIIKECGYKLQQWKKPLEREIRRKAARRDEFIRLKAISKGDKSKVIKYTRMIEKIEAEARGIKRTIKNRGVFARSDNAFAITFEGDNAQTKANDFLLWAAGARGWSMQTSDACLDDIRLDALEHYQADYTHFQYRRADWRSQLTQQHITPTPDTDETDRARAKHQYYWNEYERLN